MNDAPQAMVTAREAVLRERAAWIAGSEAVLQRAERLAGRCDVVTFLTELLEDLRREAARLYPLPRVTRPREVELSNGLRYRINDGVLEYKGFRGVWEGAVGGVLLADVPLVADLLANPTEVVEDDGGTA